MCEKEDELDEYMFPYNGKCISRYDVPKEMGGLMPTCEGKMDGSYQDDQGRCDRYFRCMEGKPEVLKCPDGANFDPDLHECSTKAKKC